MPVSPSLSLSTHVNTVSTKPYADNVHVYGSPCYGVPTSTLYILYVVTCNFLSFCLCHVNSVQFSHVIQHVFWTQLDIYNCVMYHMSFTLHIVDVQTTNDCHCIYVNICTSHAYILWHGPHFGQLFNSWQSFRSFQKLCMITCTTLAFWDRKKRKATWMPWLRGSFKHPTL